MPRSDYPKDPFVGNPPMAEDHPVIKYLDWQIACHQKAIEFHSGVYLDSSIEQYKKDLNVLGDHISDFGVPNRMIESLEYNLNQVKRLNQQLQLLKQERFRLLRDVDFHGFNYML